MFSVSSCRYGDGPSRSTRILAIAPLVALALAAVGCTVDAGASPTPAAEAPITTEWTLPADPEAEGPTAAPALPEESAALDEPIALSTEMVVSIDDISTTTITPETPGEYAGTAVVVTISVSNDATRAQSVDSAVISLTTDDGDVGVGTTAGPNEPFQGEVAPGAEAQGTYVFMLDPAEGRSVKISVNYAAGEPIATFAGQVS